jgi:HTH-type transcriptional regulator/antitoxin HipB
MSDRASAGLGPAVRARRRGLGLTQLETAELAGVAARTVHAVEAGKATVRLDALLAVLTALGLQLRLERGNVAGGLRTEVLDDERS